MSFSFSAQESPTNLYRAIWPAGLSRFEIELSCFHSGRSPLQGGLGRFEHMRNVAKMVFPEVQWNPWMETQCRSLCNDDHAHRHGKSMSRFVSWTGCASAGKTHSAGFFSALWWLCDPANSSVTLTSTSKTAIGQRVWPVIQKLWREAVDPRSNQRLNIGHLVDSMKILQAAKGDSKHSIYALAVEKGELQKAVNALKGRHTKRMMLVIDEANTTPQAVFETIPNMTKGCQDFVCLVIGNAISRYDNHGRCCEPQNGWESVTVEDDQWPTGSISEWAMESGLCCHFDGEKSPNVTGQKTLWPYIYTYEDFLRRKSDKPAYWSQDRGFWPPEGALPTVLSEVMVSHYDGEGSFTFLTSSFPVAFLDPAFGGDACVLALGKLGDTEDGRLGLQITDHIDISPKVGDERELDFQIADAFIARCKEHGVAPRYAGIDATGTGRGVYAIVAEHWSSEVQRVEFGGAPSDLPASADDPRPGKDIYDRKVTELWYSVREFLLARQLKGLYRDAIVQFCARQFVLFGKKIKLDAKEDCKAKLGRSPDDADAISGLVEVARRNGLRLSGGLAARKASSWADLQAASNKALEEPYVEASEFQEYAELGYEAGETFEL